MNKFTVVGYYDDTMEPFVDHVQSKTPGDAARKAKSREPTLRVVEVFSGWIIGRLGTPRVM